MSKKDYWYIASRQLPRSAQRCQDIAIPYAASAGFNAVSGVPFFHGSGTS